MSGFFDILLGRHVSVSGSFLARAEDDPYLREGAIFLLRRQISECQIDLGMIVLFVLAALVSSYILPFGDSVFEIAFLNGLRGVIFAASVVAVLAARVLIKHLAYYKDQLFLCKLRWPEADGK